MSNFLFIRSDPVVYEINKNGIDAIYFKAEDHSISHEIHNAIEEKENSIPLSIFKSNLTPFQNVVKFLREKRKLNNGQIARILLRDTKTIWITYQKVKDEPTQKIKKNDLQIPISVFSDNYLSSFESLVEYLVNSGKSCVQIARLVHRDQRTVWTIKSRLQLKRRVKHEA